MFKRPLLIKIVASYLLIEPMIRSVLMSIDKDFELIRVIKHSLVLPPCDIFNYWFLFPLSGLLLLSFKFYAYIGYMLLQLYSLFFHLNYEEFTWPYLSKYPSAAPILLLIINIIITIYLIFPRTRAPFINKKMRWWETPTRITTNLLSQLDNMNANILNISLTGALLAISKPANFKENDFVRIKFEVNKSAYILNSKVVRIQENDNSGEFLVGIHFEKMSLLTGLKLHLSLFQLSKK